MNKFIGITMLLYALLNPIGAIPIFLTLTRQSGQANRQRIILIASSAVGYS